MTNMMYNKHMSKLLDAVKKAIETSGKTKYRIAKESGVTAGQLTRLMSGERGLSVQNLEQLADYLGLEITIKPKRRRKGK